MRIPPSVLKTHNKKDDAWTAINGKVYNVTPYLSFHPGGEKELMRVAGRDGTKLFSEFTCTLAMLVYALNALPQCLLMLGLVLNSCWMHAWSDSWYQSRPHRDQMSRIPTLPRIVAMNFIINKAAYHYYNIY